MHPDADLPASGADRRDGRLGGGKLNEAKDILAYELTKLVHGDEEADKARQASKALFSGAGDASHMPTTG